MKLILYSGDDPAGKNIASILAEDGFSRAGEYGGHPVYGCGDVVLAGAAGSVRDLADVPWEPEYCVVASRHKSSSGRPTLTCHATGNFGVAELGGHDNSLQLTHGGVLSRAYDLLAEENDESGLGYEVSFEVTHHGPTELPFPLVYVEVGSGPKQWGDEMACSAVAKVVSELVFGEIPEKESAIGFGGPHYAPNFGKVSGYALGHMMPKYAVDHLCSELVSEMVSKTVPTPKDAVIDWKGLRGADRNALISLLDGADISWHKTGDV